jgi:methyl-accepting chemotaxis protein
VVHVKTLTKEVGSATTMSFERMTQVVRIADLQNQQIFAAGAKVNDMATSSRHVAERAQLLSNIAHNARYTAQDGHVAVQKTIAGIERISENVRVTSEKVQVLGERSREIGDIVKAISSIAHQTNRLALDAAIQAAMAGENGKGFAAVATDIRGLAERSKEQTLMIGHIVQTVLEDIHSAARSMEDTERETVSGSSLIDEAGRALDSVFSVVEQQANEIATINQVAIQQLESSNMIVQIMQNVSNSTQQSNTTTRETAQLMEHVSLLAEQLHNSIHVFKVREDRVQQITGTIQRSFSEPLNTSQATSRSFSGPLNALQPGTVDITTQPLRRNLLIPAKQFSPYPSTPHPLSPTPETPAQPQGSTPPQY